MVVAARAQAPGRKSRWVRPSRPAFNHYVVVCNNGKHSVWLFKGRTIPISITEDGMEEVDVWHSIRFFLMVVLGITALGVAFFAVA